MRSINKQVIVGIGEILWDIFPDGKKAGGAPVNFAFHASTPETESYAISAVGTDELGNEVLSLLDENKIKNIIKKVDHPTGTVLVELDNGIPTYTITENVAWDYIPFSLQISEIAKRTNAVCFGTLAQRSPTTKDTIQQFLAQVPLESFKVLDLNLRSPFYSDSIIKESIQLCNILKMNEEELQVLKSVFHLNNSSDLKACEWLMNTYNLKYLILTAGDKYSMIFSPNNVSHLETPRVDVVDTVGAGDSFTAAFITSLLGGSTLVDAHKKAVKLSAAVCSVAGAWT